MLLFFNYFDVVAYLSWAAMRAPRVHTWLDIVQSYQSPVLQINIDVQGSVYENAVGLALI